MASTPLQLCQHVTQSASTPACWLEQFRSAECKAWRAQKMLSGRFLPSRIVFNSGGPSRPAAAIFPQRRHRSAEFRMTRMFDKSFLRAASAMTMLLAIGLTIRDAAAQETSGTGSRQARQQAIAAIPFDQLTPETRNRLSPILNKPSIYRRLPVTSINVDPDMFLFLVRQPEVLVNIWQLMGVTQMNVERTGPFEFISNDGAGAVSNVELVYGTSNLNIYYADGTYSGSMLRRKLNGRAVMILRTGYRTGKNGQPTATNSLDVFLKVENVTVNLIAKTLNPIIGPTADHNFTESLQFVQRLNETTEKNGIGVQRMANRLTGITDSVREQFIQVAATVYERGVVRTGRAAGQPQASSPGREHITRANLTTIASPATASPAVSPAASYPFTWQASHSSVHVGSPAYAQPGVSTTVGYRN